MNIDRTAKYSVTIFEALEEVQRKLDLDPENKDLQEKEKRLMFLLDN